MKIQHATLEQESLITLETSFSRQNNIDLSFRREKEQILSIWSTQAKRMKANRPKYHDSEAPTTLHARTYKLYVYAKGCQYLVFSLCLNRKSAWQSKSNVPHASVTLKTSVTILSI